MTDCPVTIQIQHDILLNKKPLPDLEWSIKKDNKILPYLPDKLSSHWAIQSIDCIYNELSESTE